ncbi:hypothetical protein L7F22_038962 [Adiantum nelumboides]|nr:hypothetical protein [Adiantum nelumboides]
MSNRTTLCVLGATGFTGKFVALEVARQISVLHKSTSTPFQWSIAGRRKDALLAVREEIKQLVGASSNNDETNVQKGLLPSIVIADVNNIESLRTLASETRLILNCVGPYYKFGENVVLATIEASEKLKRSNQPPVHYIDLCGEPNFIERIVLEYRQLAKSAGSIILPASAYDSVPAELGTIFAVSLLGKGVTPASVEMLATFNTNGGWLAGHFATYACVVNGISPSGRQLLSRIRKKLYGELPKATPKVATKGFSAGIPKRQKRLGILTYDEEQNALLLPHMAADPAVVRLGQSLTLENDPKFEPVKFVGWFAVPSLYIALFMAFYGMLISFFSKSEFGRSLLLKYPKFFTGGVFSHEGPTQEQLDNTQFSSTFIARGVSHSALQEKTSRDPDVKAVVRVRGPEPGYVSTPILFVSVARAILEHEKDIIPGVSTPGAALRNTTLIKMLNDDGRIKFDRIE